jgi:hypothetical protein
MESILKKIFVFIFILTFPLLLYGQTGCRVPSGDVYITAEGALVNAILGLLIGPGYKGAPIANSTACISYKKNEYVSTGSPCRVCPGSGFNILIPGVLVGCDQTVIDGKIANLTVVDCNIDDYSSVFLFGFACLGFIIIKRKKYF